MIIMSELHIGTYLVLIMKNLSGIMAIHLD